MTTPRLNPHPEDNFRETGKFKPIIDSHHAIPEQPLKQYFNVDIRPPLPSSTTIKIDSSAQKESKLWRVYF